MIHPGSHIHRQVIASMYVAACFAASLFLCRKTQHREKFLISFFDQVCVYPLQGLDGMHGMTHSKVSRNPRAFS